MSDTTPPEAEAAPSIEDTDPEQAALNLDATAHQFEALELGDGDDEFTFDGDETVADMHIMQFDTDGNLLGEGASPGTAPAPEPTAETDAAADEDDAG